MPKKLSERDPIGAHMRKSAAANRVGVNAKCSCGESRPEALISNSRPVICAACKREREGKNPMDKHHVAGKANHAGTIPIFVNDHRSELSASQYDWPKETRENRDGSPLLTAAGCIRGLCDTIVHLVETFLQWIPELLEKLDSFLTNEFGSKWWVNSEVTQFAQKR